MYHPDFHLPLHHQRTAELQASATTHRLAHTPTPPLRTRLGWTLVELGLRLAAHPRPLPRPAISS
ncbi:hypothetical protein [Streptomyces acidiscabies]|uniref:hypothetical protein n=1 Tax=Streptomyces acidiscabies TaxID=42234 RepID=UPI00099DA604|nr:hypothetical protein [Streptomyces acidiscabies]